MGKFIIKQTTTGLKFDLKTTNDQVIATSQVYASFITCKRGIHSVKTAAPVAGVENQTVEGYTPCKHPKFEIYSDNKGEYRFRLKAKNGQIIAVSKGYMTIDDCGKDIELVKENVVNAKIEEA